MKKNVTMKLHSKLFFLKTLSVAKIINEKPVHQTAGFPKSTIVDFMPSGRLDTYNQTGFSIKGQLHHVDEKA